MRKEKQQQLLNGRRRVTGQGMTEYIIIVALIAIAAVAAVTYFGAAVQGNFIALGNKLTNQAGDTAIADAVNEQADVAPGALGSYD